MSFFKINDGRKRDVYGQRSTGDQVLHRACVVTRTARQTFIGLMRLLYLLPVQFHAQTGRIRNGNFSVFNLQRIFGQATISLLPNQWVSIAVGLPGAAAPTWVNIAREISKWLLEWQPQVSPSRRKAAPRGLHRKASRSADRQVEYLPH